MKGLTLWWIHKWRWLRRNYLWYSLNCLAFWTIRVPWVSLIWSYWTSIMSEIIWIGLDGGKRTGWFSFNVVELIHWEKLLLNCNVFLGISTYEERRNLTCCSWCLTTCGIHVDIRCAWLFLFLDFIFLNKLVSFLIWNGLVSWFYIHTFLLLLLRNSKVWCHYFPSHDICICTLTI